MAYKVFFLYWKNMKEIGEELKQLRKKSGVDLEEASHDLNISEIELELLFTLILFLRKLLLLLLRKGF